MSNTMQKRFRNFLTVWAGQTVSIVGSGLTAFAMSVWLFTETGNATPIAITGLSQWLPRIVLAPIAGMVADRYSRKLVMILSDTVAAVATGVAAALVISGALEVWHIYVVAAVTGVAGSFQTPALLASITMIVKKEDFARASGMTQVSRALEMVAAPVIAGILIGPIGLGGVILVDLATFAVGVLTLSVVPIPNPERSAATQAEEGEGGLRRAMYGLRYISARGGLMAMMIYFALVNFAANMSAILISPMVLSFADPATLGVVQTVGGVGMLIGGVAVSVWGGPKRKMPAVYSAIGLSGLGFVLMGLGATPVVAALGLFTALLLIPVSNASAIAIWQTKVAPDVQGRVFAARGMIATIMMPLAFGVSGPLADRVFQPLMHGPAPAPGLLTAIVGDGPGRGYAVMLVLGGVLLLAATAVFLLYRPLRRVETELPDVVDTEDTGDDEPVAEPAPAPAGV